MKVYVLFEQWFTIENNKKMAMPTEVDSEIKIFKKHSAAENWLKLTLKFHKENINETKEFKDGFITKQNLGGKQFITVYTITEKELI